MGRGSETFCGRQLFSDAHAENWFVITSLENCELNVTLLAWVAITGTRFGVNNVRFFLNSGEQC